MATPLQRLCLRARSCGRIQQRCSNPAQSFHTTRRLLKKSDEEEEVKGNIHGNFPRRPSKPAQVSDIDAPRSTSTRLLLEAFENEDADIEKILSSGSDNAYKQFLEQYGAAVSIEKPNGYDQFTQENGLDRIRRMDPERDHNTILRADERYQEARQQQFRRDQPIHQVEADTPGFMTEGKDDLIYPDSGDEVFEADDITSLGHGYLEEHREIREYYRWAAWELPLLTQYAKEFKPPTEATPLRFRYTTYMGEEHPAERKVVVEFCTSDLPLTPKQRLKLVKLLGQRYNPQKDMAKMSCESFPEPLQNKRYLADLIDNLLVEARLESKAEGGKDAFADIPADFRHVKWKKPPKFPEAWKMTPDRREKLFKGWAAEVGRSQQALLEGSIVNGQKTIASMLGEKAIPEPVAVRI